MLKMIFVFCVIVAVLPSLNCKPLTSYQKFVTKKCRIPLLILKTKYPEIEDEISFMDKLQVCENPNPYLQKFCQDIFTVLWDISTCNPNLIPKDIILNFGSNSLPTEEFEDTCNAFKNQKFSKRINEYPIYQILKVKSVCDFFCSVDMELCDILLWAYRVHDVLIGQKVILENKMPSNMTPNNELTHVPSVTPAITQLATSEVSLFSKEVTSKADSVEHKHPNESRNLSAEKPLKSNSVNLTKDLGMAKQIVTSVSPSVVGVNASVTSVSPSVVGVNASVTSVSPSVTSVSPSVTSVNASVIGAELLVTHTTKQAGNNVTIAPTLSLKNDDVSKNHVETKTNEIKEIQPTALSEGNEQNTKSVSKSITHKTPSSVKEEVQSLPTESNKNLFNEAAPSDGSFTAIDEFEDDNADYSNAEIEINDNNEDNKLSSSMEKKTISRNSAKSSTHNIIESGSKAQEVKANKEDSTGTVQSTKSEEKPNKSLAPENIPFDSSDKVSKESAPDEKYITGDYSLPEDGKPKSNIPASKFTESTFLSKNQNMIPEVEDPQFFFYFLCTVLIVATCYVLYHNKQKIIALIVEGCHERRRRPLGVNYRKLETK